MSNLPVPPDTQPTTSSTPTAIPDDEDAKDHLLPMTASLVLTSLPRDAHTALARASAPTQAPQKVTVRFKAVGGAPILLKQVYKISAAQRFETVVKFLRNKLRCPDTESVFLYVNSVFAPSLDEGVGNLFACFKTDDQLIVAYSMTPAFG